jgi:hypothetical protein
MNLCLIKIVNFVKIINFFPFTICGRDLLFFYINVSVQTSLRTPRLIPRALKLTTM